MSKLKKSLDNPLIFDGHTPGTSVAMHLNQRLAKLVLSEFERLIKDSSELTLASWRVLLALHQMGSSSQKVIVNFCHLDQGQVSRALKHLEDKKFVLSEKLEGDRRSRSFSLTPEGDTYRKNLQPKIDEFHQCLTDSITEEELKSYTAITSKIADAVMGQR